MTNPAFRPYAERGVHELRYIRDILNQRGEPVPLDVDAALLSLGVLPDRI